MHMQKTLLLILVICIISQHAIAQDTQDWHLRGLPNGIEARIGKGSITGHIADSRDGNV